MGEPEPPYAGQHPRKTLNLHTPLASFIPPAPTVVTRAVSIIPSTNNLPHFIINPSFFLGCPVLPIRGSFSVAEDRINPSTGAWVSLPRKVRVRGSFAGARLAGMTAIGGPLGGCIRGVSCAPAKVAHTPILSRSSAFPLILNVLNLSSIISPFLLPLAFVRPQGFLTRPTRHPGPEHRIDREAGTAIPLFVLFMSAGWRSFLAGATNPTIVQPQVKYRISLNRLQQSGRRGEKARQIRYG
jgi:hypothetical protein